MSGDASTTIQGVAQNLAENLKSYLEAQYHIRDESILKERRALLDETGAVAQSPFIEATPSYELSSVYAELGLPERTTKLLTDIVGFNAGIFSRPYVHQARALEAFIAGKNILAATGTGSGKTEIFLLSILSALAEESNLGNSVTRMPGCRALILYPMNALVSDQLARLRVLFGNHEVKASLKALLGRVARFGMYTSRTPFPGLRPKSNDKEGRNKGRVTDLWNTRFKPVLDNPDPEYLQQLEKLGKWPAKDVRGFFGAGKWDDRLDTATDDVELLMRHEMQLACPDLLITNYSMLEYMLVRPIERPIFEQTAAWLKNPGTFFTIVLDEAHLYRGATGAEVSFLLRRLISRLGVPRDRIRFILTTASVGPSDKDRESATDFACDLTGIERKARDQFAFIPGTRENLKAVGPASSDQAAILASFDGPGFQAASFEVDQARMRLNGLGEQLGWDILKESSVDGVQDELCKRLWKFPPAGRLLDLISGSACAVEDIAKKVFPDTESKGIRDKALDSLLRVCNYAKEAASGKVFLPARLHLFFRGLSGLYACVDPQCPNRRVKEDNGLIGRLYSEPRVTCKCGARVFELFTHRDCGAPFLVGFVRKGDQPDFVWHEPTTEIKSGEGKEHELERIQMHLSGDVPRFAVWQTGWLQMKSGRLEWTETSPGREWTRVFVPDLLDSKNRKIRQAGHLFGACPACSETVQAEHNRPSKIMDMKTKGEPPFVQLVKGQFLAQSPDANRKLDKFPNQGRKVLLFSDGRQKAAKLAKDIPAEVELDSFRELLALGFSLKKASQTKLSLSQLYHLFIVACQKAGVEPFSKKEARDDVKRAIEAYLRVYVEDFNEFRLNPLVPPLTFKQLLYKQVSGGLYSMRFICAGWIWPLEPVAKAIKLALDKEAEPLRLTEDEVGILAATWIQRLAKAGALDKDLPNRSREFIVGWRSNSWGHAGTFGSDFRKELMKVYPGVPGLETQFQNFFAAADPKHKGFFIDPAKVCLRFDLAHHWFHCAKCSFHFAYTFRGHCPGCGSVEVKEVDPETDLYIRSRKGYWRKPLDLVLRGEQMPRLISAEEHTAQLTHSDPSKGVPPVEDYELRFRDILRAGESPVDVLSCTTTMEVGIDIGGLVAVGLRNVPPQRENYQQRAGRAGRRGSSVSSVVTYCQGGAHDNYYYSRVDQIASGPPRPLRVKVNNEKIARRHVHAFILQEYFATQDGNHNPSILSSLGSLDVFFAGQQRGSLTEFESWVSSNLESSLITTIAGWVGRLDVPDLRDWVRKTVKGFVARLKELAKDATDVVAREKDMEEGEKTALLGFCLSRSLLPSYAFPTDLATFRIEEGNGLKGTVEVKYAAQQSAARALTEYAPGRFVTIDKKEYQSFVVTAAVSTSEPERARPLFDNPHKVPYVFCDQRHCCYVENVSIGANASSRSGMPCPLCKVGALLVMKMISPEIYMPEMGNAVDEFEDEPEFTRASPAQFPVPLHNDEDRTKMFDEREISSALTVFRREQAELVVVNKGDPQDPRGFSVCDRCGTAVPIFKEGASVRGSHKTPYVVSVNPGRPHQVQCGGTASEVFLGHRFTSDLSILRANLKPPLCQIPQAHAAHYVALQDGFQTLAEALALGAARHFDVDQTEFSAGYRLIVQADEEVPLLADLYIFDTLAGGAGYSQQLGDFIKEILSGPVTEILACKEEQCDRSCYKCVRHYHNQYNHDRLDRKVALDLLSFLLGGAELCNPGALEQTTTLRGLQEMLEFDGFDAAVNQKRHGFTVPLLVSKKSRELAVYVTHPLVDPDFIDGLMDDLDGLMQVLPLNGYYLSRNLPACFLEVKRCLEQ